MDAKNPTTGQGAGSSLTGTTTTEENIVLAATDVNSKPPFVRSVEILGGKVVRSVTAGDFTARRVEGRTTFQITGQGLRYSGPADPESVRLKRWLEVYVRGGQLPGLLEGIRYLCPRQERDPPTPGPAPAVSPLPAPAAPTNHRRVTDDDGGSRVGEDETLPPDDDDTLPRPKRLLDLPVSDPLRHAVKGVFIEKDVNGVVGEGDAGKSTLLLATGGAVAAGALALGELPTVGGDDGKPVMVASGEDSAAVIHNHLEAFAAGHRWDRDRMLGNLHVFDEAVDLDDPKWQRHLIEAANDLHIVFAIFDPLVDLCGADVDENSNTDAKRVTKYLRRFIRETQATPVLSMHVSKPAEGKTDRRHRVRGASAWRNATRSCWWVEALEGGMEMDPIKSNRLASPKPLRVKRTVVTDPDYPMMWKAAHLSLDTAGDVVGRDVLTLLRWLATCQERLSSREVAGGDHGIPRDRASAALIVASGKRWVDHIDGPRRSHMWAVTEAGRARLMLESEPLSGTVR